MRKRHAVPASLAALVVATQALPAQTPPNGDARVANALSAAPASVARAATVMTPSGEVLRQGDNGWVCMPDDPTVPNNAPMCLDAAWLSFIEALMSQRKPKVEAMGVGYMLQGDMPVSNTDPYATAPSPDNQWIADGPPHIMIVAPDPAVFDAFPTDPGNGGPWVMWKGTPYAHLMIPTSPRAMGR